MGTAPTGAVTVQMSAMLSGDPASPSSTSAGSVAPAISAATSVRSIVISTEPPPRSTRTSAVRCSAASRSASSGLLTRTDSASPVVLGEGTGAPVVRQHHDLAVLAPTRRRHLQCLRPRNRLHRRGRGPRWPEAVPVTRARRHQQRPATASRPPAGIPIASWCHAAAPSSIADGIARASSGPLIADRPHRRVMSGGSQSNRNHAIVGFARRRAGVAIEDWEGEHGFGAREPHRTARRRPRSTQ